MLNVLIIDSHNMIHRMRHTFGRRPGEHMTTFGFIRGLKAEITKHSADIVYVVNEGYPAHRYALNPDYKGTRVREKDNNFTRQKKDIFELCKLLPVTYVRHRDYECDDVIGYIAQEESKQNNVTIVSSDTDFIQLLDHNNVKLWNPIKKQYVQKWPVDYASWKALTGDKADNVQGFTGIGAKRAHKIMESADTLDKFLSSGDNRALFENYYAQIKLAALDIASDGWEIEHCKFNEKKVREEFTNRAFRSIVGKSWQNWTSEMERLNNVTSKRAVNKRTTG